MKTGSCRVRRAGWAVAGVWILATILGPGCGQLGGVSEADIAKRLAAARKTGYPVTLTELDEWNRGTPSELALAPIYEKALRARSDVKWGEANFIGSNKAVIAALLEATARGKTRFPITFAAGYDAKLPHLSWVRDGVRLLATNAVDQAEKGNMHAAFESLRAGIRVARSLEQESVILSMLVEAAGMTFISQSAGLVLGRDGTAEDDLVQLDGELKVAEHSLSLERVVAGERCLGIWAFEQARKDPASVKNLFGRAPEGQDLRLLAEPGRWRRDFAFFLDVTMSNLTAVAQPFPGALAAHRGVGRLGLGAGASGHAISAGLLGGAAATNGPYATATVVRYGEMLARIRCLRAAVAVERSRLKSPGKLPSDLPSLVPAFLKVVPEDPFDGQPVRYKRQRVLGYAVYCVGQDLSDDAGKPRPRGQVVTDEFDVGVTVGR